MMCFICNIIVQMIGAGMYGEVVAVDAGTVVKRIKNDVNMLSWSFIKEASVLLSMKNTHGIVQVKDIKYDVNSGEIYMERHDCNISELDVNEHMVYKMLKDISIGLSELHKKGIIHRDIKETNILYNKKKDEYCLCDFGISSPDIGYLNSFYTVLKTHNILSLMEDRGKTMRDDMFCWYNNKIDMWCLGLLLARICGLDLRPVVSYKDDWVLTLFKGKRLTYYNIEDALKGEKFNNYKMGKKNVDYLIKRLLDVNEDIRMSSIELVEYMVQIEKEINSKKCDAVAERCDSITAETTKFWLECVDRGKRMSSPELVEYMLQLENYDIEKCSFESTVKSVGKLREIYDTTVARKTRIPVTIGAINIAKKLFVDGSNANDMLAYSEANNMCIYIAECIYGDTPHKIKLPITNEPCNRECSNKFNMICVGLIKELNSKVYDIIETIKNVLEEDLHR